MTSNKQIAVVPTFCRELRPYVPPDPVFSVFLAACKFQTRMLDPTSTNQHASLQPKKSRQKSNPFRGAKLTPKQPKLSITFELTAGIAARATFNRSSHPGRLSRGTISLIDSNTGYLMQKDPEGTTHDFTDAVSKALIVPLPASGQSQAEIMEITARKKAQELCSTYRSRILSAALQAKELGNLSMDQAIEIYVSDYLAARSSSPDRRKTIKYHLTTIAAHLGNTPLKSIKKSDIDSFYLNHTKNNGDIYIADFYDFLKVTSTKLNVSMPAERILSTQIKKIEQNNEKARIDSQRKRASNSTVFPFELEQQLDLKLWHNLHDPSWAATCFLKESGLTSEAVCTLKMKDIIFPTNNPYCAFIHYHRADTSTYTHDYTFPLSPFGAYYLYCWIDRLQKLVGDARVQSDRYIFSSDMNGYSPLKSTGLTEFINRELSRYVFGYSGRIPLPNDTYVSTSIKCFKDTREMHFITSCRLGDDPAAIDFLCHRDLSALTQADNYRCFVDVTGRNYLFRKLQLDTHGVTKKTTDKPTRISTAKRKDGRQELRIPPQSDNPAQDTFIQIPIKGLRAGDAIEIYADNGCYSFL